jgi:hypothetical protein
VRLADEIGDFGGLVGLLLALATLLTANRASALDGLKKAPRFDSSDKWREALLDAALAIITALVFLSGLPLAVRAARNLHPLAHGGPLRGVFVLSWALLIGLVAWQLSLVRDALKLKPPP